MTLTYFDLPEKINEQLLTRAKKNKPCLTL